MEKIKIKREYIFTPSNKFSTWGQIKEKCKAHDDWVVCSGIYFEYYDIETDEEYERRMKIENIMNKFKEKAEYDLYLKLKENMTNNSSGFKQNWVLYTDLQKKLVITRKELNQNHFKEFLEFSLKGVIKDLKNNYFQKENGKIFKILDVTFELLTKGYNIHLHTAEIGVIVIYFREMSVPESLYKSLVGNYTPLSEIEFKKVEKQRILKEIENLQKQLKEL